MKTKNKIITTPNEVASYVTWVINDFIINLQSKKFELQELTAEKSDKFKRDTIKDIKAGILKEAPGNYLEQKDLLQIIDEAKLKRS